MKLQKKTGGCSFAGYEWENDGDVVEVPDDFGLELISIDPDEYSHVPDDGDEVAEPAPEAADEASEVVEGEPEPENDGDVVDEAPAAPAPRRGRGK